MSATEWQVNNLTAEQIEDWWASLPPLPSEQPSPYRCSIYAIDVPEGEREVRIKVKPARKSNRSPGLPKASNRLFDIF